MSLLLRTWFDPWFFLEFPQIYILQTEKNKENSSGLRDQHWPVAWLPLTLLAAGWLTLSDSSVLASPCSYSARTGFWVRHPHPPTWQETQLSILPNEATLLLVCCLWLVLTSQDAEICFSSVIYQSLLLLALESGVFSSTRRPANNWYLASFTQSLLISTLLSTSVSKSWSGFDQKIADFD